MDEASCVKRLTSYAASTIRKVTPRDAREKPTWAKAEIVDEKWTQEDILKQIRKLNESDKRTVADKKVALAQFQQGQITTLLDELGSDELDPAFEWSLVQLDRTERQLGGVRGSNKKPLYETVTMTVYVKRAPSRDVDAVKMYRDLEMAKADRMSPPQSLQQMRPPQPQQQPQPPPQFLGMGVPPGLPNGKPGGNPQVVGKLPPPPPPEVVILGNDRDRPNEIPQQRGTWPPVGQGLANIKNSNKGRPVNGQGQGQRQGSLGASNKSQNAKLHGKGVKLLKQRSPNIYDDRSSDSSSSSTYDSDFECDRSGLGSGSCSDSRGTRTSISSHRSQARQPRKHSKGPVRTHSRHRPKYHLEARSPSLNRHWEAEFGINQQQRPYVPEVPRATLNIDHITSSHQAGKEDVMAERLGGVDRFSQQHQQQLQPQQTIQPVIGRIVEARNVVSYGREEPLYAERPQLIESRYNDDRQVDDLWSIEDDHIVNRRRAEEYIDRRELDRREVEWRDIERRELNRRELGPRELNRREYDWRPIDLDRRPMLDISFDRRPFPPRPDFTDRSRPREFFERRRSEYNQPQEFSEPLSVQRHRNPLSESYPFALRRYPAPSTSSFDSR